MSNPIVVPGTRIRLVEMLDDPHPIETGAEGTVRNVVPILGSFQIQVDWDNGRTLSLISPVDKFEIAT